MTFGRQLLPLWGLQPDISYLNHGAFGATPRRVLEAQQALQWRMEAQPMDFFVRQLPELCSSSADELAAYVGADEVLLVDNATTGVNAVLRSLPLKRGDRVLALTHVYPAVHQALRYVAERAGARIEQVPLEIPADPDRLLERLEEALPAELAVLDHITSGSGLVLPIEEMVALCRRNGTPVLVDGAHAPGQVPLKLRELGATWYTGNCHKWLCAPKGVAFLHAAAEGRTSLQPTVISHAYGDLRGSFEFTGTRDYTPWLSLPATLAFRRELGDRAVRDYNHRLALQAREILLDRLGTVATGPASMVGSLVCVRAPESVGEATWEGASRAARRLWEEERIEVPFFPFDGALWLRVSAQVYNEAQEYERLAELLCRPV